MSTKQLTQWLEREDRGAVTIVRFRTPDVPDEDVVRTVFDLIFKLISEAARNQVILNLASVDLFPSLGLGKLIMVNRKAQSAGGRLILCHLSSSLRENLERTHLIELFTVVATEEEALATLV